MLEWLIPILGGIGTLGTNIVNWFSKKSTNDTNKEINKQNLDYNAAQTQAQWERDDNAHQREVADLKAAGLSPLASTNGANTSSALGAPNPIAMEAPQVDINSIINAALENKALNETERHNRVQEGQKYTELHQQAEQIKQKAQEISLENKKIEETIRYNSQYLSHLDEQLTEVKRSNSAQEDLKRLQIESEEYFKSIQAQTHGKFNFTPYTDLTEYETALSIWATEFEAFLDEFQATSTSENSSKSNAGGAGVSIGGQTLGGSINGQGSHSESSGSSQNISQKQQAMMDKWYATHPMPVYIYYSKKK